MKFLLLLSICFCIVYSIVAQSTINVQTTTGIVQGYSSGSNNVFRGIPYAAPSIGSSRWSAPTAFPAWDNVRSAYTDGNACYQVCDLPPNTKTCPPTVSEDCLFLNVFTPNVDLSNSSLPVMFFIHGGGFTVGYGAGPLYDGSHIANLTNTIVIAINYRLGAFGFLATGSGGIDGNFGLKDQVFALQWVQANAAAFGGDPARVTIFGESAGGVSVSLHLTIRASEGLFANAIIESNPFTLPLRDSSSMPPLAKCFSSKSNCSLTDADCMRALSSEQVYTVQDACGTSIWSNPKALDYFLPWTPYVDGDYVTAQPLIAFANGNYTKVPIIIGNVQDECVGFIYAAVSSNMSFVEYQALLTAGMGLKEVVPIDIEYPPPIGSGEFRPLASTVATDWIMLCSNRNVTRSITQNNSPVWYYSFNKLASFSADVWNPDWYCYDKVCHGSELPFVFNSCQQYYNYTQSEEALSLSMVYYWAGLAHGGDPNYFANQNKWPQYSENNSVMQFNDVNTISNNYRQKYCDFWDKMGYGF